MGSVKETTEDVYSYLQCQLGVLPLGTGNDLARVLGWGPSCDDDTQLPQILEKLERASTKMLDRYKHLTSIETANLEHFPKSLRHSPCSVMNIYTLISFFLLSWQQMQILTMPQAFVVGAKGAKLAVLSKWEGCVLSFQCLSQ